MGWAQRPVSGKGRGGLIPGRFGARCRNVAEGAMRGVGKARASPEQGQEAGFPRPASWRGCQAPRIQGRGHRSTWAHREEAPGGSQSSRHYPPSAPPRLGGAPSRGLARAAPFFLTPHVTLLCPSPRPPSVARLTDRVGAPRVWDARAVESCLREHRAPRVLGDAVRAA